jgi:hypothetical protein
MLRRLEKRKRRLIEISFPEEIYKRELRSQLESMVSVVGPAMDEYQRVRDEYYAQKTMVIHDAQSRIRIIVPDTTVIQDVQGREMRCVTLLAHILPERDREEWLGELRETRCNLVEKRYSWWGISFITWMWLLYLGWTLIKGFNFSKKK